MKRVFHKNCAALFRAFLFAGVLTALLFSCGEGVRLFPFPISQTAKNDQPNLKGNRKIPYQANIHRFENSQGNFQTKSQRDDSPHKWANGGILQNKPKPVFSTILRQSESRQNYLFFQTLRFHSSQGSRAPPVA